MDIHLSDAPRSTSGTVRSVRERVVQTLWFEGLGLLIVSPLFAQCAGTSPEESLTTLVALSVAVMTWSALYNTAFDLAEARRSGRLASDRPAVLRIMHTVGQEATATLVTWPLLVALTPLGWTEALVADFGLTLAYAVYGYLFHLGFDRVRPVAASQEATTSSSAARSIDTVTASGWKT